MNGPAVGREDMCYNRSFQEPGHTPPTRHTLTTFWQVRHQGSERVSHLTWSQSQQGATLGSQASHAAAAIISVAANCSSQNFGPRNFHQLKKSLGAQRTVVGVGSPCWYSEARPGASLGAGGRSTEGDLAWRGAGPQWWGIEGAGTEHAGSGPSRKEDRPAAQEPREWAQCRGLAWCRDTGVELTLWDIVEDTGSMQGGGSSSSSSSRCLASAMGPAGLSTPRWSRSVPTSRATSAPKAPLMGTHILSLPPPNLSLAKWMFLKLIDMPWLVWLSGLSAGL